MTDRSMKPIDEHQRRVISVKDGTFLPLIDDDGRKDGEVLQVNPNRKPGYGFHIYRMPAGHTTTPHVHQGDEEFFIIEGEIIDHDGYRYRAGDLVWLEANTKHHSYSPEGALLVVYFR